MSLKTRANPETGVLEVLVRNVWVRFDEYRRAQIDEAYLNSIRFLRDRLGEEIADGEKPAQKEPEAES